jgi:hypothetical protein
MKTLLQMRFAFCLTLGLLGACGDDNPATIDARVVDPVDASNSPDASCYNNPQTHTEIINACTTATKILKPGKPPLLNPDGSLPPIP